MTRLRIVTADTETPVVIREEWQAPDWYRRAGCNGYPPAWWFAPKDSPERAKAIAICEDCPVLPECDQMTRDKQRVDTAFGIWAGRTETARKKRGGPRTKTEPPARRKARAFMTSNRLKWFTVDEITVRIDNVGYSAGLRAMTWLHDHGEVERRNRHGRQYEYRRTKR